MRIPVTETLEDFVKSSSYPIDKALKLLERVNYDVRLSCAIVSREDCVIDVAITICKSCSYTSEVTSSLSFNSFWKELEAAEIIDLIKYSGNHYNMIEISLTHPALDLFHLLKLYGETSDERVLKVVLDSDEWKKLPTDGCLSYIEKHHYNDAMIQSVMTRSDWKK
jgi:hypothetical protein